ncbi:hypothetical protein TNCT_187671, partial [Trichonephila clavata]
MRYAYHNGLSFKGRSPDLIIPFSIRLENEWKDDTEILRWIEYLISSTYSFPEEPIQIHSNQVYEG